MSFKASSFFFLVLATLSSILGTLVLHRFQSSSRMTVYWGSVISYKMSCI